MSNVIISTEKLCKTFSNGGIQQHVLKNLDIEIYEGDFTVIMGSSGAGKSTLLYALSGMDKPTLGKIKVLHEDISELSNDRLAVFRRNNCGFVFPYIYDGEPDAYVFKSFIRTEDGANKVETNTVPLL